MLRRLPSPPFLLAALILGACAHVEPSLDYDLPTFTAGVDALLTPGMPYNEGHKLILDRFPPPDEDSEAAPLISMKGLPQRNRRFTMLWRTTTPGVSLVLTIECDRDLNIARWITGPLYAP